MPAWDWSGWVIVDWRGQRNKALDEAERAVVFDGQMESWDADTDTLVEHAKEELPATGSTPAVVPRQINDAHALIPTKHIEMEESNQDLETASPMYIDSEMVPVEGALDQTYSFMQETVAGTATSMQPSSSRIRNLERETVKRILLRNQPWNSGQI